jgi:hypothetical protein
VRKIVIDGVEYENRILNMFMKKCERCRKTGLVPNDHKDCIGCVKGSDNSKQICLMCGRKDKLLFKINGVCLGCLLKKEDEALVALIEKLTPEQRYFFEEYAFWHGCRTSSIILD